MNWDRNGSAGLPEEGMMGRKYASYAVRVEPRYGRYDSAADVEARCEQIVAQILRHVDDVINASVVADDPVCEFCGDRWTEENPRYNGGCCNQDQEKSTTSDRLAVHGPEEG